MEYEETLRFTVHDESFVVAQVLSMLEGLEADLFSLESNSRPWNSGQSQLDQHAVNATSEKSHQQSYTWTLNYHFRLPGLIPHSLYPLIQYFMNLATSIQRLKHTCQIMNRNYGQCYFAFAQALSQYIQSFYKRLQPIIIKHQSQGITLIELQGTLRETESQINFIQNLTGNAVLPLPDLDYSSHLDDLYPDRQKPSIGQRTAHLMDHLVSALDFPASNLEFGALRLTLFLLLATLTPLLEKMQLWIHYGYISKEDKVDFFIRQNSNESVSSSLFWDTKYALLRDIEIPLMFQSPIDQMKQRFTVASMILEAGKASAVLQFLNQTEFPINRALSAEPSSNVAIPNNNIDGIMTDPLIVTIMDRVRKFIHNAHATFAGTRNLVLPELFPHRAYESQFIPIQERNETDSPNSWNIDKLGGHGKDEEHQDEGWWKIRPRTGVFNRRCKTGSIDDLNWSDDDDDGGGDCYYANKGVSGEHCSRSDGDTIRCQLHSSDYSKVSKFGLPMSDTIKECILEPIRARVLDINETLMKRMVFEKGILRSIWVCQSFFFFNLDSIIDLFHIRIFPQLLEYRSTNEVMINQLLKQSIEAFPIQHKATNPTTDLIEDYISMHVLAKQDLQSNSTVPMTPVSKAIHDAIPTTPPVASHVLEAFPDLYKIRKLKSIEDLRRVWMDVEAPWPTSLVVTTESVRKFNDISNLLLCLWGAQWSLEQLFSTPTRQSRKEQDGDNRPSEEFHQLTHKMDLFKYELLFFVRNIREYMANRIEDKPWELLEKDLDIYNCPNMGTLRAKLDEYLSTICDQCFVSERLFAIKNSLDRILAIVASLVRQHQLLHSSTAQLQLHPSNTAASEHSPHHLDLKSNLDMLNRLNNSIQKSRTEFHQQRNFMLTIIKQMAAASTSNHLSNFLLRIEFSMAQEL